MNIILSSIGALKNPKESTHITLFLLASELRKQGHDIRIVLRAGREEQVKEEIQHFPIYRTTLAAIPLLLYKLNKKKKIDIVHYFSASPLFLLPHLFNSGRKVHTLKSYSRSRLGRIGYVILRFADAVTVPTHYFLSRLPFKKNVKVINSPIDTCKFKASIKKNKNKSRENKVVLYYGAMTQNKGAKVLLQSIPYVLKELPNTRFLFYPRHSQIKKWTNLAKELHIEKHCDFIMDDVDIAKCVRTADMVVLPYINLCGTDGNPSCLLEAMACGTPVITADLPELREIAGSSAEFTRAGDHKDLAEKIVQSLKYQDKNKLKEGIRIASKFSAAIVAREMEEIYARILFEVVV